MCGDSGIRTHDLCRDRAAFWPAKTMPPFGAAGLSTLRILGVPPTPVVAPEGFEPTTPGLRVRCSTKLNYGAWEREAGLHHRSPAYETGEHILTAPSRYRTNVLCITRIFVPFDLTLHNDFTPGQNALSEVVDGQRNRVTNVVSVTDLVVKVLDYVVLVDAHNDPRLFKFRGGPGRSRTPDLLRFKKPLYQLSY